MDFETLTVTLDGPIATVRLNRPDKANAMNLAMWHDLRRAFEWVDRTPAARVAVLEGQGRHFTSGIDLQMMAGLLPSIHDDCDGRARENLRRLILDLQDTLSSLERCRKPVLAAVHGACIGGGVDLICCADMRYASADASFVVKEIDLGMVADVGTLQRLPKLIGAQGLVRELAYTGRAMDAAEAHSAGLVNRVFDTPAGAGRRGARDRRHHRGQVAAGHARRQGDAALRARPQRGRWAGSRRDVERRDAAVRRPDGGDGRRAAARRAALSRLSGASAAQRRASAWASRSAS